MVTQVTTPLQNTEPLLRNRQHLFQSLLPGMLRDDPASAGVDHGIELSGRRQDSVERVEHLTGVAKRDALPAWLEQGRQLAIVLREKEPVAGGDFIRTQWHSAVNASAEKIQRGLGRSVIILGAGNATVLLLSDKTEALPTFADQHEIAAKPIGGGFDDAVAALGQQHRVQDVPAV